MWIFGKSREHREWEKARERRLAEESEAARLVHGPSDCHEFYRHEPHGFYNVYTRADSWCRGLTGGYDLEEHRRETERERLRIYGPPVERGCCRDHST